MWNVLKNAVVRSGAFVGRGVRLWIELLGQNPSLCRDPGIVAWKSLSEARARAQKEAAAATVKPELPAGEQSSDDPLPPAPRGRSGPRQLLFHGPSGTVCRVWLRHRAESRHQSNLAAVRLRSQSIAWRRRWTVTA